MYLPRYNSVYSAHLHTTLWGYFERVNCKLLYVLSYKSRFLVELKKVRKITQISVFNYSTNGWRRH
jgi:hypothetical protein